MSTSQTPNYGLNQWSPEDQFLRTEFNADNARTDAALAALAAAAGEKAAQADLSALAAVVEGKAAQSALDSLVQTVNGKAAQAALDSLKTTVDKKAKQSALDSLVQTVNGKASQAALDNLKTTVNGKAAQSSLDSLSSTVSSLTQTVNTKAAQTALNSLTATVNTKASQSDLNALSAAVNVRGNCRIATGSYTGSGTYGSDNPNRLTFPFVPLLVVIQGGNGHSTVMVASNSESTAILDQYYSCLKLTWSGAGVSWYVWYAGFYSGSSCSKDAMTQLNESGKVYWYLVLGSAG